MNKKFIHFIAIVGLIPALAVMTMTTALLNVVPAQAKQSNQYCFTTSHLSLTPCFGSVQECKQAQRTEPDATSKCFKQG